jgi:hypothetical protein
MSGFCLFLSLDAFLDNYSYFGHRVLDKQINELEDNANYYKEEIKKDQEYQTIKESRTDRKIRPREILYEKR